MERRLRTHAVQNSTAVTETSGSQALQFVWFVSSPPIALHHWPSSLHHPPSPPFFVPFIPFDSSCRNILPVHSRMEEIQNTIYDNFNAASMIALHSTELLRTRSDIPVVRESSACKLSDRVAHETDLAFSTSRSAPRLPSCGQVP